MTYQQHRLAHYCLTLSDMTPYTLLPWLLENGTTHYNIYGCQLIPQCLKRYEDIRNLTC